MSKGRKNAKWTMLIVLCCVLAVVLAALVAVTIVTNRLLNQVQRPADTTLSSSEIEEILNGDTTAIVEGDTQPGTETQDGTEPTKTTDATEPAETVEVTKPKETVQSKEIIHFLLIGQNGDAAASRSNAEAVILCTVNKTTKTVTLTSYQRNAEVNVPGYGKIRLSLAYATGGMKLLNQTLEENYGVKVDANIAVNYSGLINLVDMVGGIPINLTEDEANYLNDHGNWGVTSMGGWNLKVGQNTLTGEEAMGYALLKNIGGEEGRTARQRNVISALTEKAKNLSITQLYDFVEKALGYVATDMTNSEILGYVAELAPMITEFKLTK